MLRNERILDKETDCDIDRDSIYMLTLLFITKKHEFVVVHILAIHNAAGFINGMPDLNETIKIAFLMGINFFELSAIEFYLCVYLQSTYYEEKPIWDDKLRVLI